MVNLADLPPEKREKIKREVKEFVEIRKQRGRVLKDANRIYEQMREAKLKEIRGKAKR